MLFRLWALRLEYQATRTLTKPILDVQRYTAMTTFNAWKDYLRKRKPVYHQVYRYTRSLLLNHNPKDKMPQMAAWEEAQSNGRKIQIGGLAQWRDQKQPSVCGDRLLALLQTPKALMGEAWAQARQSACLEVGDPLSHDGLYVIFAWLNHPVTLNHLTQLLCAATDRIDARAQPLQAGEEIPDPVREEDAAALMQMFWGCAREKMTPRSGPFCC